MTPREAEKNHTMLQESAKTSHACVLKICFPPSRCSFQKVMPMSCLQPKSSSKCDGYFLLHFDEAVAEVSKIVNQEELGC